MTRRWRRFAAHWQELGDRRVAELVSVASDAIVSVDAQGKVRLINRAAAGLFGVSAERALGQEAEAVLPGWLALEFSSGDLGLTSERRQAYRPGKALRLFRGDGAARTVEPIVFQQGSGDHRLITVVLRDATDRVAAEQRREALRDAVVASAAQLSLLLALSTEAQSVEDLAALAQGRATLPPCAPQLREFDLAQALAEIRQWAQERTPPVMLTCSLPNRTLGVLGDQPNFVAGLRNLLGTMTRVTQQPVVVEIVSKVDETVNLELTLPSDFDLALGMARPDWRFALTQFCAGGAVESQTAGDTIAERRRIVFKLFAAQRDRCPRSLSSWSCPAVLGDCDVGLPPPALNF